MSFVKKSCLKKAKRNKRNIHFASYPTKLINCLKKCFYFTIISYSFPCGNFCLRCTQCQKSLVISNLDFAKDPHRTFLFIGYQIITKRPQKRIWHLACKATKSISIDLFYFIQNIYDGPKFLKTHFFIRLFHRSGS